jgi:hypothetical protein
VKEFFTPMSDANLSSLREDVRASPDDDAPGCEFLQGSFIVVVSENEVDLLSRAFLQEFQKRADSFFVQIETTGAPLELYVVRQISRMDDPRGGELVQKTSQMAVHGGGRIGDVKEHPLRKRPLSSAAEETKETAHVFDERHHGMPPFKGGELWKRAEKRWRDEGVFAPPLGKSSLSCCAGNIRPR